jgi:excinuclease UvrABC nuclease subunit
VSAGTSSGTRSAKFDQRGAYLTFDALEKIIIQAVAAEEFEVAAEYVDQLFILAEQLDEYHEEYRVESERLAERDAVIGREEEAIEAAISGVRSWAVKHDHPVQEWFEGGESA